MPSVRDLLGRKPPHTTEVVSLPPSASALDAAQLMNERGVGAVLVMAEPRGAERALVGIFTERDVLRRVVATQRHPREVPLAEVMTRDLVTCDAETSVDECAHVMTTRRIRHLPVVGPTGAVMGMISIGDVLAHRVVEQQGTIEELNRDLHDLR